MYDVPTNEREPMNPTRKNFATVAFNLKGTERHMEAEDHMNKATEGLSIAIKKAGKIVLAPHLTFEESSKALDKLLPLLP
jgi:hypothetical protein